MKRLAILGAGGHGKVVADAAECAGWSEVLFFDDRWPEVSQHSSWKVIGNTETLKLQWQTFDGLCIGIGNNEVRLQVCSDFLALKAPLVSIIHPHAVVSRYAEIGLGTVVFAGGIINADARLGLGCIINTGATIDHDCQLGNGVHLSPGVNLAGGVFIDECSWIGIGAVVNQLVRVGRQVIVGSNAAVIRDIPDNQTVVGVPAINKR